MGRREGSATLPPIISLVKVMSPRATWFSSMLKAGAGPRRRQLEPEDVRGIAWVSREHPTAIAMELSELLPGERTNKSAGADTGPAPSQVLVF
jgi:hypothetical protein